IMSGHSLPRSLPRNDRTLLPAFRRTHGFFSVIPFPWVRRRVRTMSTCRCTPRALRGSTANLILLRAVPHWFQEPRGFLFGTYRNANVTAALASEAHG